MLQFLVLLTLTGACAIHCRYCFRRHLPYGEAGIDYDVNGAVMRYVAGNPEVNEVILSGGDPLMVSDARLARLVRNLNRITHIRTLRIHSRVLSVLPERVTAAFIGILQEFRGQVVLVTHINHPNEISALNHAAFGLLVREGFRLFNQSVLLRRVNDNAQTRAELSNKLFESGIMPYYLHRLDRVQGAAHRARRATQDQLVQLLVTLSRRIVRVLECRGLLIVDAADPYLELELGSSLDQIQAASITRDGFASPLRASGPCMASARACATISPSGRSVAGSR